MLVVTLGNDDPWTDEEGKPDALEVVEEHQHQVVFGLEDRHEAGPEDLCLEDPLPVLHTLVVEAEE